MCCSKDDSVAYAEELPKDLPSLIRFVLRYSSASTKLQALLDVCSHKCLLALSQRIGDQLELISERISAIESRRTASQQQFAEHCVHGHSSNDSSELCQRLSKYISVVDSLVHDRWQHLLVAQSIRQLLTMHKSSHQHSVRHLFSGLKKHAEDPLQGTSARVVEDWLMSLHRRTFVRSEN